MDQLLAALPSLIACGLAAAAFWFVRQPSVPSHSAAIPSPDVASSGDGNPRFLDLVERIGAVELDVAKLRREQASFIEDAEMLFDAVERKRKSAASSAAKAAKRDVPSEEVDGVAEIDRRVGLNPDRRAELRAVAARLGPKAGLL